MARDTSQRATFKKIFTDTKLSENDSHSNGEPVSYNEGLMLARAMVLMDEWEPLKQDKLIDADRDTLIAIKDTFKYLFRPNRVTTVSFRNLYTAEGIRQLYSEKPFFINVGKESKEQLNILYSNWNGIKKRKLNIFDKNEINDNFIRATYAIASDLFNKFPNLTEEILRHYAAPLYASNSSITTFSELFTSKNAYEDSKGLYTFKLEKCKDIPLIELNGDPSNSKTRADVINGYLQIEYNNGETVAIDLVGDEGNVKQFKVHMSSVKSMWLRELIINVKNNEGEPSNSGMPSLNANFIPQSGSKIALMLRDSTGGTQGWGETNPQKHAEFYKGCIKINPTMSFDSGSKDITIILGISFGRTFPIVEGKIKSVKYHIMFLDNFDNNKVVKYENNLKTKSSVHKTSSIINSNEQYPQFVDFNYEIQHRSFIGEIISLDVNKQFTDNNGKKLNVLGTHRFYNRKRIEGAIFTEENLSNIELHVYYVAYIDETGNNLIIDYIGKK